jgi:hypothetical protein
MSPFRRPFHAVSLASLVTALLFTACGNPGAAPPQQLKMATNPNQQILDELNTSPNWFHAKKTRPIWARTIEQDQKVTTLEGEETVKAGHILCRGEAGDIWPQTAEQLAKRYKPTEEIDAEGWLKHLPNPDAQGVMAIQVGHQFEVQASWGKLSGKQGDYLLKNFQDRDTPYPDDVWIVDQKLFAATYERVAAAK